MRIRLEFHERCLLTKEQRSSGLRRCWFLIKPELATTADIACDIFDRFSLSENCPEGIFFSIDDFVVPSCEPTTLFREEDTVRVHKRTCKKKKIKTRGEMRNGMLIESRETIEMRNYHLMTEGNSSLKRKHKEIEKPHSSKKKKLKLITIQETLEEPNQRPFERASEKILHEKESSDVDEVSSTIVLTTDNSDVSNETRQTIPENTIPEKNKELEESCTNTRGPDSDNLTKKFLSRKLSRSTRRKYAKREMKRKKKRAAEV